MEFNEEELSLLDFCVDMSIRCMNQVPSKKLKRVQMNKVVLINQLNDLLLKVRGL